MTAALLRFLFALSALASGAAGSAASSVVDVSRAEPDGTRTLHLSIEVPAPVADVWSTLTTSEGWRGWAAPMAQVDFRLGGIIETSYNVAAVSGAPGNIRNEILAYVPLRMFAIRNVQAPPRTSFDVPTFQSLHTVILVDALDGRRTRVSFVQPGYRGGEPWDTVYKHFAAGAAQEPVRARSR